MKRKHSIHCNKSNPCLVCQPAVENTDRELYRDQNQGNGAFYADSLFVTKDGAIGINCGGSVIIKTLREWHRLVPQASLRKLP